MKPVLIATLVLSAVALLHVLRVLFQVDFTVGGFEVPLWASVFAAMGAGGLAVWLWREQER